MKLFSNHSINRKYRSMVAQSIVANLWTLLIFGILLALNLLIQNILFICQSVSEHSEINMKFTFDDLLLFLIIYFTIFIYYFIYTLSISNLILLISHKLKIFKFSMYSKTIVYAIATMCTILQFMILPVDNITGYNIWIILAYYIVSILVSVIFLIFLKLRYSEKYKRWIRINLSMIKRSSSGIYFVNETNDTIICFLIPTCGIIFSLIVNI